jgi:hypothetical protein
MAIDDPFTVVVRMIVAVCVDPTADELSDKVSESQSSLSIDDVVRSEIASNLESISFVRHVSIIMKPKPKGGAR